MATVGTNVERQSDRNRNVTATTRTKVINIVWITSKADTYGKPVTKMYGISRFDDEKRYSHGWRVSLHRKGNRLVENFPDKKYGGRGPKTPPEKPARPVADTPENFSARVKAHALAEPWSPWRAVAARLLWAYYRVAKNREGIVE